MDPQHWVKVMITYLKDIFFLLEKYKGPLSPSPAASAWTLNSGKSGSLKVIWLCFHLVFTFYWLKFVICTGEPAVQAIPLPGPAVSEHKFFCQLCKVIHFFLFCFDHFNPSLQCSDPNLDPDPYDPYVFGSLGSAFGSVSHKYGSGCGSGSVFYLFS